MFVRDLIEQIRDEASILLSGLEHSETEVVTRLEAIERAAVAALDATNAQTRGREVATGLSAPQTASAPQTHESDQEAK